jgi:MHS family proline/betaine transporter-like MFS transporter
MGKNSSGMRPIWVASIGNALEWYDFSLYGYLAPTIQQLFFPHQGSLQGLLSVFLVFAVGLFFRPIGGIFFAFIGDKVGRKAALIASVSVMAIPMTLIGFLPTYNQVGALAVGLLVFARLLQGFAVGGELIGSMTFLAEHADSKRRGFLCSLIYSLATVGGLLGALAAASLHLLFSPEEVLSWGWRLPFFLGIPIGAIGLYIRLKVSETPAFLSLAKRKQTARSPFKEALQRQSSKIGMIFLVVSFQAVGFYLPFVYLPTWLSEQAHFSSAASLLMSSAGLLALIVCTPLSAALSDRIGRRKVMLWGSMGAALVAIPGFELLAHAITSPYPFLLALLAILMFAGVIACFQGPMTAWLTESVPTKNRYMTLVIGYNLSVALFGGITPYLSTYLTGIFDTAPSILLIVTALIAFCVLLYCKRDRAGQPLI